MSNMGMAQANESPFRPNTAKIKHIMPIWIAVFAFAMVDVTRDNPFLSIVILSPVTKRSRKIMSPTIQNSIIPINANEINAEETKKSMESGNLAGFLKGMNTPDGAVDTSFLPL